MPKITVEEQKEFSVLPADSILHLKVDELSVKEVQGQHGPWSKLEFKFKILGIQAVGDGSSPDDYEDLIAGPIWGSVPFKLTDSPENRLRQWAEAILGIELGIGYELDTDLFLGREVRGITSQYDKKMTNKATGQPYKGHQIDSLLIKAGPGTGAAMVAPGQQQWGTPAQDPWATPAQPQQAQQQRYAPTGQDPWAGQPGWEEPPF